MFNTAQPIPPDGPLVAIRRSVLLDPDEDTHRLVYADRVEELDYPEVAAAVREQIYDPFLVNNLPGSLVHITGVITAWYRRGFVDEVLVARADLHRLGDVLRDHPVRLVVVARHPYLLTVHRGGRFGDTPGEWGVLICIHPRPGSRPAIIPQHYRGWPDRDAMAREAAGWARSRMGRMLYSSFGDDFETVDPHHHGPVTFEQVEATWRERGLDPCSPAVL